MKWLSLGHKPSSVFLSSKWIHFIFVFLWFFFVCFLVFFWLHPWCVEVPRPGTEPPPQQWPIPLQQQARSLTRCTTRELLNSLPNERLDSITVLQFCSSLSNQTVLPSVMWETGVVAPFSPLAVCHHSSII